MHRPCPVLPACLLLAAACGDSTGATASASGSTGVSSASQSSSGSESSSSESGGVTPTTGEGSASAAGTSSASETGGTTEQAKFDIGFVTGTDTGSAVDKCKVQDDMNAIGDCEMKAPPDSFMPEVQWEYMGEGMTNQAVATPLVANLTDDNGDGEIDLCDVPDVIIPLYGSGPQQSEGYLYVLSGDTGALMLKIPEVVDGFANPALGDIDADGVAEIVTIRSEQNDITQGHVIALEHDGTLKWESATVFPAWQVAVALADLDADGDVEILAGNLVLDHLGATLWSVPPDNGAIDIPVAVDLDGDGDLEVLHGGDAFHHDGSVYYDSPASVCHPSVANLDADPEPEVLLACFNGLTLLEHDGTVVFLDQKPGGDASWWRPAAVHDIDGDGGPEIVVSSDSHYSVYKPDLTVLWTADVVDDSGFASGTAFDFLGAGYAEAMYADEHNLFVYSELGQVLLSTPRGSWTQAENPVVADVDNDGSAEIVVVSNSGGGQAPVQVIRDVDDRWIQARRIWNQHAYHVTNVREDGTIPKEQTPSWQTLNTFRTNAQIEGGTVCNPIPPG